MSSSRERSQTTKPNRSIPRGGRLLSLIFALSRNPNRLPPRTHKKERLGVESKFFDTSREAASSLDGVNGMSDPPWRLLRRGKHRSCELATGRVRPIGGPDAPQQLTSPVER